MKPTPDLKIIVGLLCGIVFTLISGCTKHVTTKGYTIPANTIDRVITVGPATAQENGRAFCAANGGPLEVRGRYQGEQFSTIPTLGLAELACSNLNLKVQWLDADGVFADPSMELQTSTDSSCKITITDSRFNGNTSSGTRIKVVAAFKNNPSSATALEVWCDAPPADSISEILANSASCYQNNKTMEVSGFRGGRYFKGHTCADMSIKADWINGRDGTLYESDVATADADCKLVFRADTTFFKSALPGKQLRIRGSMNVNPSFVKEAGLKCF